MESSTSMITRPRVVIPGKGLPSEVATAPPPPVTPTVESSASSTNLSSAAENIGRWTDQEHELFLEGLAKHGKQWKNIATMIGSRTIVQVRTHAQKYFQKMERHGGKPSGFMATSPTSKPKGTLTTRSKKSPKHTLRSTLTHDKNKGTSHHLTADNLYIHDKAFLMDEWRTAPSVSSLENSSTISPDNVLDFAYQGTSEGLYLDYPLPQSEGNYEEERALQQQQSSQEEEEDPLEWLMEGGLNHLPESTLVDPMATVHGSEDFHMLDHVPSMWLDGGLVLAKDE